MSHERRERSCEGEELRYGSESFVLTKEQVVLIRDRHRSSWRG